MSVAVWGKALTRTPRPTKEEWRNLDPVSRWRIVSRAAVLVIALISSGIAGMFAFMEGGFDLLLWTLVTLGLLMAHATNNFLNDLTNHLKGADAGDSFRTHYGVQPVEAGLLGTRGVLLYAAGTDLVALLAGVCLVYLRGMPVLVLLAAGAFFVLFYYLAIEMRGSQGTRGPRGVRTVDDRGGYYKITGEWNAEVVQASLPHALGTTAIIFGRHIGKLEADRERGIRTLPVLLGGKGARYTVLGTMVIQYLLVAYLLLAGFFTPVMLVVFLSLYGFFELMVPVYRSPRPASMPREYRTDVWTLWYVTFAFLHNRRFGAPCSCSVSL